MSMILFGINLTIYLKCGIIMIQNYLFLKPIPMHKPSRNPPDSDTQYSCHHQPWTQMPNKKIISLKPASI